MLDGRYISKNTNYTEHRYIEISTGIPKENKTCLQYCVCVISADRYSASHSWHVTSVKNTEPPSCCPFQCCLVFVSDMSVAQSPDISDIHPATVTVAETLSVTTDSPTDPTIVTVSQPQTLVTVPAADTQTVVPSVGASISVPDSVPAGSISERSSSALLNLASNSLSLTEILSAQQQALEQFQCQLQLAQQTEAINQRLDAIERTLNSLIQQKVQEDAAKNQESTPVRPSQQVHLQSTPELGGEGLGIDILKRKKLPRELCVSVFDVV